MIVVRPSIRLKFRITLIPDLFFPALVGAA